MTKKKSKTGMIPWDKGEFEDENSDKQALVARIVDDFKKLRECLAATGSGDVKSIRIECFPYSHGINLSFYSTLGGATIQWMENEKGENVDAWGSVKKTERE